MDVEEHGFESDDSVGTIKSEALVLENLGGLQEKRFLKGVAISMWQNSGDTDSNWTRFTKQRRLCGLRSTIADGTTNTFPDTWNRYKEDIALLKEMNCNAFRFSLEWARIEPEQGKYDPDAIARYHEIFDCLEENGITSSVTLHHFVHPGWFQDLGGFEKEGNIKLFVDFSVKVFTLFCNRVTHWATFNEPTVYVFCSYMAGLHAPGTSYQFRYAGVILLHLMKAHTEVYKKLKSLDVGKDCVIGIVHHCIWFVPTDQSVLGSVSRYASEWMTYWWGRDLVLNYFKNGQFAWKVPLLGTSLEYTYPDGKPPCDWWGINYYSRVKLSWMLQPQSGDEIMTDMDYPIHPRGLYRVIKACSVLGLPMYISETGVADDKDDRRHVMIRGYTNELMRAIKHGYDVRGIFYWTLIDNFEWNMGYKPRFGLYAFDPAKGVDRQLREKAKALQAIYKIWPSRLVEMYRFARATVIPSFRKIMAEYREEAKEEDRETVTAPAMASSS